MTKHFAWLRLKGHTPWQPKTSQKGIVGFALLLGILLLVLQMAALAFNLYQHLQQREAQLQLTTRMAEKSITRTLESTEITLSALALEFEQQILAGTALNDERLRQVTFFRPTCVSWCW